MTRPHRMARTIARLTGDGMSEYFLVVIDGVCVVCTSETDERVVSAGEDVVRVVVRFVE